MTDWQKLVEYIHSAEVQAAVARYKLEPEAEEQEPQAEQIAMEGI